MVRSSYVFPEQTAVSSSQFFLQRRSTHACRFSCAHPPDDIL